MKLVVAVLVQHRMRDLQNVYAGILPCGTES